MDYLLDDFTGLGFFALYLNQMSHTTMFLTSHLRTIRTRNQTEFQYISVLYGHILVTLRVPLRLFRLVDLQESVAPYSYKRPFQIVSFVLLIIPVIY